MDKGRVLFLGVARAGFDTDLAFRLFRESAVLLEKQGYAVIRPEAPLTDPDEAGRLVAGQRGQEVDALILQFSTFTDGRFVAQVIEDLELPVLIWSVPEPELGGRLRLNSLTGTNLAASLLVRLGQRFKYLHGLPDDQELARGLEEWLAAVATARRLRRAVIAELGTPPPGFYTSSVDALQLMHAIGPRLLRIDLHATFQAAAQVPAERYRDVVEADRSIVRGLDAIKPEEVVKSAQVYLALRDKLAEVKAAAVAVRCWPEFFTEYGAAACSTLSHLIEDGIPAACEADALGAVTMLIQHYLTGAPTYLGDLVHVNPDRSTGIFWHCGAGAFSLASTKTEPIAGVQPSRNMGFALNNRLKGGPVTVARLGQADQGFRMLIVRGEALGDGDGFLGTSVEVRFERPVREVLDDLIYAGFEHHYSLVWEDIVPELIELCSLLDVPVVRL